MSESGGDNEERSHDPTPGRLEKARRDGDVAQSRELNAAAAYAALFVALVAAGGASAMALAPLLTRLLADPEGVAEIAMNDGAMLIGAMLTKAGLAAAAFLLGPAAAVAVSIGAQRAYAPSLKKIKPQWSRLSPAANAKRKFGPEGFVELARSAVNLAIVGGVFWVLYAAGAQRLPLAALTPAEGGLAMIIKESSTYLGAIVVFAVAVAVVDTPLVQHRHKKRLMMSLDELRREAKETEGDPHFKHQRRERGRAIATNRMLNDVPKASVVIVNPEHYAVALKWDGPKTGAPVVVAKGVDEMARLIRERAAAAGVPLRRDPPTARAIFAVVKIGEEVRREHYAAVAAAIHFADAVRRAARSRGGGR